ncbi:hypothetical protein GCM10022243_46880 [Saccharothrix violaceirubra]|uniref:Histidine kinase/DNA gyrase B/HSP90-like ATPase n=1 Tax=Saccharothrix violaceirubra TaxID=413306 RepID=A0A7W7WY83_9PSEU|nr:hypothetical protein [Saccharothrix violaceirubra]MBB4967771.1 hypothetical protein [Saccharothrix violaceirubra]
MADGAWAADSPLWGLASDADRFGPPVLALARSLDSRRVRAEEVLAGDPWLDPDLAARMASHLAVDFELSGAEAALLVLAPMLHQVRVLEAAAAAVSVGPTSLREPGSADYARFLSGPEQRRLVDRTAARPEAGDGIGWWLFHQWVAGRPDRPAPLATGDRPLQPVLACLDRIEALFHLTPGDLRDDRRRGLEPVRSYLGFGPPQEVREELLGLLLVVARELAIGLTALPITVVEHLGIPNPVRLGELRTTIAEARWEPMEHVGVALLAHCRHEAVLESLRDHVRRTDAVLGAVRDVAVGVEVLKPLRSLPAHASADRIRPAEENGRPVFVVPVTRFRLEESRVRELLMGEQLYGDRSLAIRELYQNALDACRYRKARYDYQAVKHRSRALWEGRITFTQGREDGRYYLRCHDNGVGMGESELREVFSRAGARFADRPEFAEEQARWEAAGVELFPNSRFGIGVLSYFMLADEIEVRTRRMSRDGFDHGQPLRVMIAGPGHLFRIEPVDEDVEPGTTVTLYLRDGDAAPSCVDVLNRLLGLAEFATTATHDDLSAEWEPFRLEARPRGVEDGVTVSGMLVHSEPTEYGQVVWCEGGGGLLVDGIHAEPVHRRGVLSPPPLNSLGSRGAVVNLHHHAAPRLSVDRKSVLDDVSSQVESLLRDAARELVAADPVFLTHEWICDLAVDSPFVADIVTDEIASSGRPVWSAAGPIDMATVGCFPWDWARIRRLDAAGGPARTRFDHAALDEWLLLWRLLAHRGPEVLGVDFPHGRAVRSARPSDAAFLGVGSETTNDPRQVQVSDSTSAGYVLSVAAAYGIEPVVVAQRLAALGIDPGSSFTGGFDDPDRDSRLLSTHVEYRTSSWLDPRTPVSVGRFVYAHVRTGIPVEKLLDLFDRCGFDTRRVRTLPRRITRDDLTLVGVDLERGRPWLPDGHPVSVEHVCAAAAVLRWSPTRVTDRLAELGFSAPRVESLPDWAASATRPVLSCAALPMGGVVEVSQLVRASVLWDVPPREVARRFAEIGIPVPPADLLPDTLDERDRTLLSGTWLRRNTPPGPVRVGLRDLLDLAENTRVPVGEAWTRLAELKFDLPSSVIATQAYDEADRLLMRFSPAGEQRPHWETRRDFGFVLEAAREIGRSAAEIVRRLRRMGLEAPIWSWPDEPLTEIDYHTMGMIRSIRRMPLAGIARVSKKTGGEAVQVAERVRKLGYDVDPVPERLDPFSLALLDCFDRFDRFDMFGLDLRRPVTMRSVLDAALWFEIAPAEVVERLAALGLEVPDLAVELPKLLAKVPLAD